MASIISSAFNLIVKNQRLRTSFAQICLKPLTTTIVNHDWIRRNTPRKPEIYKVSKEFTLVEEDIIDIDRSGADYTLLPKDEKLINDVAASVNHDLQEKPSRNFAVVHIGGKQFKVTTEDLISVSIRNSEPRVGDTVRLEKVLTAGSQNFTLIGRPLLNRDKVTVDAIVAERTLLHPKLWYQFHKKRRHRKMRESIKLKPSKLSV